jgi:Flp pilus assembly protein TadD
MCIAYATGSIGSRSSWVALIALAIAAASLGGCEVAGLSGPNVETAQAQAQTPAAGSDQWRAYADDWGKRYDQNPGDKTASINYARGLRALTRYVEATAVMRTAAIVAPQDNEVLGEFGKALADSGELSQAKDVLTRAYPEDRPDWMIMSVQGAVEDELGDHDGARKFYAEALKIAPGEPFLLNNLGLSYALTKQLPQAEATLREANASPHADARVRNNLALVLSLEGKYAQAEDVSRQDMSDDAARANVKAIRQMVASRSVASALRSSPQPAVATE